MVSHFSAINSTFYRRMDVCTNTHRLPSWSVYSVWPIVEWWTAQTIPRPKYLYISFLVRSCTFLHVYYRCRSLFSITKCTHTRTHRGFDFDDGDDPFGTSVKVNTNSKVYCTTYTFIQNGDESRITFQLSVHTAFSSTSSFFSWFIIILGTEQHGRRDGAQKEHHSTNERQRQAVHCGT